MPSVIALSCPVCGAPLDLHVDRCSYCRSIIVLKTERTRIDPNSLNRAVIDENILEFRKAVRKDPYDEAAHYGLGLAYFNLGLLTEAADQLSHAAQLMPENPDIHIQLALVFKEIFDKGETTAKDQMVERLKKTLLLDPKHTEGIMLKADLFERAGKYSSAIDCLLQLDPAKDGRISVKARNLYSLIYQQLLKTNTELDLRKFWDSMDPNYEDEAKRQKIEFLQFNKSNIPKAISSVDSEPVNIRSVAKILGIMALCLFGMFLTFMIGGMIITLTGLPNGFFVLVLLITLASPFILFRYFHNRGLRSRTRSTHRIDQQMLLSGNASMETLDSVLDHIFRVIASNPRITKGVTNFLQPSTPDGRKSVWQSSTSEGWKSRR